MTPYYIDVFVAVLRDNQVAQVAVAAVLLLTLLDVIFGIANAVLHKEFSSEKMREGIGHKCVSFGFVLVGIIIDGTIIGGFDLGYSAPVLTAICAYLCIMEIASLLETFAKMNPEIKDNPVVNVLKDTKKEAADGVSD